MSKNLNSFAVFSRWIVPAWTLSNLIALGGKETRATLGHRPPRMMALTRLVFVLWVLRWEEVGLLLGGTKLSEDSEEKRSLRREVMSRMVEELMKFYLPSQKVSH